MPTPFDCRATGAEQTAIRHEAPGKYEAGSLLCGKYRLEALLGEGGMGSVWRASNVLLDLPIAIKLIRADLDHGELRARLQVEARAAAKLGHPAIVRVYDVGESELGDPFIVMEHLRGETLGQLLSRGRMPATRAVQLLLPIIDALAMAHGRGIVHRDLKPDNVMIALEEQHVCPKILDFGIAKLTDPNDSHNKLTQVGAVVGSPEYMSPEQARGQEDVDAGTDIWSICVVLYEAVTGCPPFTASNYNALLRSIVEDDPKPLSAHAAGDDALGQILQRGLNKDRTQRYAKISLLGQALAGWLFGHGVTEDACGSSLDSKWFSRNSDPLSLGEGPAAHAPSEPQASRSHESIPHSTGMARGPFTATIHPVASGRTLTLGAAVAGCALLGLTLLALGHSPVTGAPTLAHRPTAAKPLPAPALAPSPPSSATGQPSAQAPLAVVEILATRSAQAEREAKPTVALARITKPAWIASRANAPVARPAASSAAPPPLQNRPLDLLPPY